MKLLKLNLLSLVLLLLVTSCQKDEIFTQEEANYSIDLNLANETDWQMADEVLAVINTHRASLNLQPLQRDQQYASAYAVEHTLYMIEKAEINHHNFGVRNEGLRSKGAVKVNEFSNKFYGGGGHENAAGAAVESTDLDSVTLKLIENFRSFCLD